MSTQFVTLSINGGTAGESIEIVPRDRGPEPPPPILDCGFNSAGSVTIVLPRGNYVVLATGFKTVPVDLLQADAFEVTITLAR